MSSVPIVSILTPTLNRSETYLPAMIKSIQSQRESGFTHEHIIVDNASTDRTEEVIRGFMKEDPRIKYIRNDQNIYASGALNVAFEKSVGELIIPFDDDDLMPELSLQMRFDSLKNPKLQWTSGCGIFIDQDNRLLEQEKQNISYAINTKPFLDDNNELADPEKFFLSFFRKWMICGGTVTIRRKCIEEVEGWNPEFMASQDSEMWVKLAHRKYRYKLLDSYVFFYRVYEGQSSSRNAVNGVWKMLGEKLREQYQITDEMLDRAGIV